MAYDPIRDFHNLEEIIDQQNQEEDTSYKEYDRLLEEMRALGKVDEDPSKQKKFFNLKEKIEAFIARRFKKDAENRYEREVRRSEWQENLETTELVTEFLSILQDFFGSHVSCQEKPLVYYNPNAANSFYTKYEKIIVLRESTRVHAAEETMHYVRHRSKQTSDKEYSNSIGSALEEFFGRLGERIIYKSGDSESDGERNHQDKTEIQRVVSKVRLLKKIMREQKKGLEIYKSKALAQLKTMGILLKLLHFMIYLLLKLFSRNKFLAQKSISFVSKLILNMIVELYYKHAELRTPIATHIDLLKSVIEKISSSVIYVITSLKAKERKIADALEVAKDEFSENEKDFKEIYDMHLKFDPSESDCEFYLEAIGTNIKNENAHLAGYLVAELIDWKIVDQHRDIIAWTDERIWYEVFNSKDIIGKLKKLGYSLDLL